MPESNEQSWVSYSEYVRELSRLNDGFGYLKKLFAKPSPCLGLKIFDVGYQNIERFSESVDDLKEAPEPNTTRIVVLLDNEKYHNCRVHLNDVALILNLPPLFLWRHLQEHQRWPESHKGSHVCPPNAAVETESLKLQTVSGHLSAIIATRPTVATGATCRLSLATLQSRRCC